MRYLILILALFGCGIAHGDDAPAAKKETYTEAVARYEASLAGLSATVGNTNAELSAIEQRLGSVEKKLEVIEGLLTPDVPSLSIPQIIVPAPPAESASERVSGPTLNGKPLDVAAVIKANYRVQWSFPEKEMTIDQHLAEHGVAGVDGLSYDQKRKLHSALHEMGEEPPKAVVKSRTVVKAPVVMQQNCPGGVCPMQPRTYYYSTRSRRR